MEERRNDERKLFSALRLETGVGGGREGKEQSEYDHSTSHASMGGSQPKKKKRREKNNCMQIEKLDKELLEKWICLLYN